MRLTFAASLALLACIASVPQAGAQPRQRLTAPRAATAPNASLEPAIASAPATGELDVRWNGPNGKDDYIVFARPGGADPAPGPYPGRQSPEDPRAGRAGRLRAALRLGCRRGGPRPYEDHGDFRDSHGRGAWPRNGRLRDRRDVHGSERGRGLGRARQGRRRREHLRGGRLAYANNGSPARLRLPADPGLYEVRYVSGLDPRILAARKVEVSPATATVKAPERGMAGTTIQVAFTGQGGGDSFIGVVKQGAEAGTWIAGAYERPDGGEVSLRPRANPALTRSASSWRRTASTRPWPRPRSPWSPRRQASRPRIG